MRNEPLTLPDEEQGGFRKSFLLVLAAHVVVIGIGLACARLLFKSHKPEQITWLDGGGELGAAASLPLPESGDTPSSVSPPQPEAQVLPPLPPDPLPAPKELDDLAMLKKTTPTPTPRPRPTATPTPHPKHTTPHPKPAATPTPAKKVAKSETPKSAATPSHAKSVAKLATPKPGAKPAAPKITDSNAKPDGAGTGSGNAASGSGNATNAGTKGGVGAAGGSAAVLTAYFSKVEAQFRREWEQPLTVVRSGRDVEAHVRLRAAADGTVESLKLVKPTGNLEVDQSIEQALERVKKVDKPPAALLKNGVLDELVAFILEL
ncbi:MAG: cell envelope integrity protein TolA [Chthoniobacteraceae bacterium]